MARHEVKDLDRVQHHEPLDTLLCELQESSDPFLLYQASYAFQALQYVPDNETILQAVMRHSGVVAESLIGISGVLNLNLSGFLEGLGQLQKTVVETLGIAKSAIDGARSLIDSGKGVFEAIKKGASSGYKRAWYPAIIGASALVQERRLADFRTVVLEAPCRHCPEFQWGICQLLGEIAMDHTWETATRQEAVDFLVQLRTNDPDWGKDTSVKMWMLTILHLVSTASNHALTIPARLQQAIEEAGAAKFAKPYPLRSRLPLPEVSSLLLRVQKIPPVERKLEQLRAQRGRQHDQKVLFIPPLAKANLQALDKEALPLMDQARDFLNSKRQVFLIMGDSGAGKSTFNRQLEQVLWNEYKQGGLIPVFINLPEINDPRHDLIDKQLRIYKFSDAEIKELKDHRQLALICDSYDESQLRANLHGTNKFNQEGPRHIKMIITCRSTYIGKDYLEQFRPQKKDHYDDTITNLYKEAVIVPFSNAQIENYVSQFVPDPEAHQLMGESRIWSSQDYMEKLRSIPNLMELVKNPFLLSLALKALPGVVKYGTDVTKIKVTRLSLYDSFIDQWLGMSKRRLGCNMTLSDEFSTALWKLQQVEEFKQCAITFLKNLAAAIFREQGGSPAVHYIPRTDQGTWKSQFFDLGPDITLLRESCPLSRAGNHHMFIHQSLLEYFYFRHVYERNKTKYSSADVPQDVTDNPLYQRSLVEWPAIVHFLAEYAQDDFIFEEELYHILEQSKTDTDATQGAANAISILARAGKIFNGKDFRGIKIPGADLTGGHFDHAQLQQADLRGVNFTRFTRTWLRQADLTGALMNGVRFGERPFLKLQGDAVGASSPDGKILVLSWDKELRVYNVSNSELLYTPGEHDGLITCLDFSSNGFQIASGSMDKTVRIWDLRGTRSCRVLRHARRINALLFSPDGTRIAVASGERVLVRDFESEEILSAFNGSMPVKSLAWLPDGSQIASIRYGNKNARLRDAGTGEKKGKRSAGYPGDRRTQSSIAISRDGLLATCDKDNVCLWDLNSSNGNCRTLQGHTEPVICVNFSDSGRWIVTTSEDRTVRVWETRSGLIACRLDGHRLPAGDAFFLNEREVVSIEAGGLVMLWELSFDMSPQGINGHAINPGLQGHTMQVTSVMFSPNKGEAILSCSRDGTVRKWDTRTGTSTVIASIRDCHSPTAAYSPHGNQIAVADGDIKIYSSHEGVFVPDLDDVHRTGNIVSYSPNGGWIAYADEVEEETKLWDFRLNKEQLLEVQATGLTFSPDGKFGLISCGAIYFGFMDGDEPILYEVDLDEDLYNAAGFARCIAYSPCGEMLAIGYDEGNVIICYPWLEDELEYIFDELWGLPLDISWSSDGHWIACGCSGGSVQVLRVHEQSDSQPPQVRLSCEVSVKGFGGEVASLDWHPDPQVLLFVTGSHDCSVCVCRLIEADQTAKARVQLVWGAFFSRLMTVGMKITGVQGLKEDQRKFLVQREAVEELSLLTDEGENTASQTEINATDHNQEDKEKEAEDYDLEVVNSNDDEDSDGEKEEHEEECEDEE